MSTNDSNKQTSIKVPQLKSEYSSLKELKEDLAINHQFFTSFYKQINKDYESLSVLKKEFPRNYVLKDDFEDLLLKASQAKHFALTTNKLAMGLSEELGTKYKFFRAHFEIFIADDELKARNFSKITDSLRDSYIRTHKEMTDFEIMAGRYETLVSALDKLFKMFESDEINFRRFLEKKDKLMGLK